MSCGLPEAFFSARIQPISPAFPSMSLAALKAAAAGRAFRRQAPSPPATIPPAHALVIRLVPSGKQWAQCLQIAHDMTLSWSNCMRYGHQRYPVL